MLWRKHVHRHKIDYITSGSLIYVEYLTTSEYSSHMTISMNDWEINWSSERTKRIRSLEGGLSKGSQRLNSQKKNFQNISKELRNICGRHTKSHTHFRQIYGIIDKTDTWKYSQQKQFQNWGDSEGYQWIKSKKLCQNRHIMIGSMESQLQRNKKQSTNFANFSKLMKRHSADY